MALGLAHCVDCLQFGAEPHWPFAQVDAREELAEKLEALYRVMGARGKVRQKRSRPLRAQLVFSCPKTAVALETGTPEAPRLFEVALHQLDCTLLAGSQNSRQLQSGAGPISIDVSCPANLRPIQRVHPSSEASLRSFALVMSPAWVVRHPSAWSNDLNGCGV